LIRALSDKLYGPDDACASHYGWQIITGRAGMSRTYRDPRFDRLGECLACRGTGTGADGRDCDGCAGMGVTTASPEFRPGAR
jgi:hypothetical protein